MNIKLTPAAQQEVDQTLGAYEALLPGIAKKISAELDSKFAKMLQFPESYQRVNRDLRRMELQTIPFQIYNAVLEDEIPVLGFVPARLHPGRKQRLMSERLSHWQAIPSTQAP